MLKRMLDSSLLADLCERIMTPSGAAVYGVCDGGRAALAAAVAEKTGRQVLYITQGDREAARIAGDLQQYLPQAAGFLRMRERQFARAAASRESEWQRLGVLERAHRGQVRILCIPSDALLWRLTPPALVEKLTVSLRVGDTVEPALLIGQLIEAGYERVDMVEGRGQCALRGAIVDVFPPAENDALRIEFFGDEVDGIRAFDCVSQRSLRHMDEVRISPAGEYLLQVSDRPAAAQKMRALTEQAHQRTAQSRPQSQILPETLDREDNDDDYAGSDGFMRLLREAEHLAEGGLCRSLDLWAQLLMPKTCNVIEYLWLFAVVFSCSEIFRDIQIESCIIHENHHVRLPLYNVLLAHCHVPKNGR